MTREERHFQMNKDGLSLEEGFLGGDKDGSLWNESVTSALINVFITVFTAHCSAHKPATPKQNQQRWSWTRDEIIMLNPTRVISFGAYASEAASFVWRVELWTAAGHSLRLQQKVTIYKVQRKKKVKDNNRHRTVSVCLTARETVVLRCEGRLIIPLCLLSPSVYLSQEYAKQCNR